MEINSKSLPLIFNIVFPLIGIFFLNWSIGDIYLLFFFEILFLGVETMIKILFAFKQPGIFSRVGSLLRFLLIYPILFLFILILTGNFFDGGGKQMFVTIGKNTIYLLTANYLLNLFLSYFWSGKFKEMTCKEVEKETYYHLIAISIALFLILLPLSKIIAFTEVNFALATSLILVKNAMDYWISYRKKG